MPKATVAIKGTVASGRGIARAQVLEHAAELHEITDEVPFPGSLNVVLHRPLLLSNRSARRFGGGHRLLWPGTICGMRVWIYRWQQAPLHILEVLSPARLRDRLDVRDGEAVLIEIDEMHVERVGKASYSAWVALWAGRTGWPYTHDRYYRKTKLAARLLGATQEEGGYPVVQEIARRLYRRVKRVPGVGPAVVRLRTALGPAGGGDARYVFEREDVDGLRSAEEQELGRITNVLNYTKTSGSTYAAKQYPAGYHTLELFGRRLDGQRDPLTRFRNLPLDFRGKRVLDIGTNQGGMLLCVRDQIELGVGLDYDPRMVNAANRLAAAAGAANLRFFVFDLEKDPLRLILDLIPGGRVDVVLLLSVCMWIDNWRSVVRFCAETADTLVFESNGSDEQQVEQEAALRENFAEVALVAECSDDDPRQKRRKLFLCRGAVAPAPAESCGADA